MYGWSTTSSDCCCKLYWSFYQHTMCSSRFSDSRFACLADATLEGRSLPIQHFTSRYSPGSCRLSVFLSSRPPFPCDISWFHEHSRETRCHPLLLANMVGVQGSFSG